MAQASELYRSYLGELRKSHPQDEPVLRAAVEAFDAIRADGKATELLLQPIVQAAADSRKMIFEIPVDLLDRLTELHREACEAVTKMAEDKHSHVRFNAVMCIGKASPISFQLQLLRQSLRDKSARVRQKAADWAGRLRLRELVPELERAFASETNDKARATIEFELRLLRDGYILETQKDGTVCVTAYTPRGCGGRWFSQAEIDRRGIEAIVAEFAVDPLG